MLDVEVTPRAAAQIETAAVWWAENRPAAPDAIRIDFQEAKSLLSHEPGIAEIGQAYIRHKLMPADPAGDALHLALASYHKCDFLVTWNCRNLANANKFEHIRRINTMLGLFVPILATPLELLGGNNESE